jgi:hypothetical protein
MTVPLRASGPEKAEAVRGQLKRSVAKQSDKIFTRKGITTYSAQTRAGQLTLRWDAAGHFLYDASGIKEGSRTRKVRNVAEALRLAGV